MIFVNSKRRKWPCVQKGQREGNYDSDKFRSRTLRYSLRRVSPLDSVNWGTHNPKVGGSNPPPATKLFKGLRASDVFTAGAKKGDKLIVDSTVKCVVVSGGRLLECFRRALSPELIGAIAENLSDSVSQ
jgi:hypothetical protein